MNRYELVGRYVEDPTKLERPGDFSYGEWGNTVAKDNSGLVDVWQFCYICPCGSTTAYHGLRNCALLITKERERIKTEESPLWQWDGDREKPTLQPSIKDKGCGYHGYLVAGVWKFCDDSFVPHPCSECGISMINVVNDKDSSRPDPHWSCPKCGNVE